MDTMVQYEARSRWLKWFGGSSMKVKYWYLPCDSSERCWCWRVLSWTSICCSKTTLDAFWQYAMLNAIGSQQQVSEELCLLKWRKTKVYSRKQYQPWIQCESTRTAGERKRTSHHPVPSPVSAEIVPSFISSKGSWSVSLSMWESQWRLQNTILQMVLGSSNV